MTHLTVAASEAAFIEMFKALRDSLSLAESDSADFGPFTAGYDIALHLEGGSVDLRADNTVQIKELDVEFDIFKFFVGIDIPEICVGGWCIPMPWPIPDICLPEICVFDENPDIAIELDLAPVLGVEISATASLVAKYAVNHPPAMNYLDAEDADMANEWQVFIDPQTIDFDLFDIADIVGDLLEDAVDFAIDDLLGFLPGWARDAIKAILGPVIDLIRAILDLPDDIGEWIADLLNVSFGLGNLILTFIADYFANKNPIVKFEDPYPIMPYSGALIPVKIPVQDFSVMVNDDEMILQANVGVTL
jgi:hypothetical protein